MVEKLIRGIRKIRALHELGFSYSNILTALLSNKDVNLNMYGKMNIRRALYISYLLKNIRKKGWTIKRVEDGFLYENNGLKLYGGLLYGATINEIFVQEVYKANVQNKVVIDVGAYLGETAIYFALKGAKKVIAFEPDEENYRIALKNVNINGLADKIMLVNAAVTPACLGLVEFYKAPETGSSTDYENMYDKDNITSVRAVKSICLDDIVKEEGRIGLLKLDCEGCEYSVLTLFNYFREVDEIILEYHNGVQNLRNLLSKKGFRTTIIQGRTKKIGILRGSRYGR